MLKVGSDFVATAKVEQERQRVDVHEATSDDGQLCSGQGRSHELFSKF